MITRKLDEQEFVDFLEWIPEIQLHGIHPKDWNYGEKEGEIETTFEVWQKWDEFQKQEKIIEVTFKTPDVLSKFSEEVRKKLAHWIKYDEYITIQFDLVHMKAYVIRKI